MIGLSIAAVLVTIDDGRDSIRLVDRNYAREVSRRYDNPFFPIKNRIEHLERIFVAIRVV
jgi:hypothetical protein